MFAKRFKKLREQQGWTQEETARRLGTTRSTIGDYETGRKLPKYDRMKQIADLFHTSIDYLLGRTDIKEPVNELQKLLQEKIMDLEKIAKLKRQTPTFRGRPISEEEAKEWNKIFDVFLDLLEAKMERDMERDSKNGQSGMIDAS